MKNRIAKKWSKKVRNKQERYILENKLINPIVLNKVIDSSALCQRAIREFIIANRDNSFSLQMFYNDVLSLLAVISSQGHSNSSIHYILNVFNKLVNYKIISPLTFIDTEWNTPDFKGTRQNIRASNIFKEKSGEIFDIYAFNVKTVNIYDICTDNLIINKYPMLYSSTLYEYEDNKLTGRYFKKCRIKVDEHGEYTPKKTITIPCVEIEYAPGEFIMCYKKNDNEFEKLNKEYDIVWNYDSKLEGLEFKNFTKETIDYDK